MMTLNYFKFSLNSIFCSSTVVITILDQTRRRSATMTGPGEALSIRFLQDPFSLSSIHLQVCMFNPFVDPKDSKQLCEISGGIKSVFAFQIGNIFCIIFQSDIYFKNYVLHLCT